MIQKSRQFARAQEIRIMEEPIMKATIMVPDTYVGLLWNYVRNVAVK